MTNNDKSLHQKIEEAAKYIRERMNVVPEVALILGTGLGNFAKRVAKAVVIPYESIPHFPRSTVESHAGQLSVGMIGKRPVVAMEGRFHFYEGYSLQDVTFPVRVLRRLGAKILIVSNAAGAMNLKYRKGDLVLIDDHINFMGVNPLIGPNDDKLGPRFPDMSSPYSKRLIELALRVAAAKKMELQRGVYMAVTGPNLETRAEYRMMKQFADVVGMSTVPEVIVGVHAGFEILGVSVATDLCDPDDLHAVDIKEIIKTANEAGPKLDQLIEAIIKDL